MSHPCQHELQDVEGKGNNRQKPTFEKEEKVPSFTPSLIRSLYPPISSLRHQLRFLPRLHFRRAVGHGLTPPQPFFFASPLSSQATFFNKGSVRDVKTRSLSSRLPNCKLTPVSSRLVPKSATKIVGFFPRTLTSQCADDSAAFLRRRRRPR